MRVWLWVSVYIFRHSSISWRYGKYSGEIRCCLLYDVCHCDAILSMSIDSGSVFFFTHFIVRFYWAEYNVHAYRWTSHSRIEKYPLYPVNRNLTNKKLIFLSPHSSLVWQSCQYILTHAALTNHIKWEPKQMR